MARKKKARNAGVPGTTEGRSELSNAPSHTGTVEPSLHDDVPLIGNRDDQVPPPAQHVDEVVPGGTVSCGDGEANSRGPSPSGTRRDFGSVSPAIQPSVESVVTPSSIPTFKSRRNFGSPDPPGAKS